MLLSLFLVAERLIEVLVDDPPEQLEEPFLVFRLVQGVADLDRQALGHVHSVTVVVHLRLVLAQFLHRRLNIMQRDQAVKDAPCAPFPLELLGSLDFLSDMLCYPVFFRSVVIN